MFGQKCQGKASQGKALEDNTFKTNAYKGITPTLMTHANHATLD
jgi:hypothetical protein